MAVLSKPLVLVLLSDKWLHMSDFLSVLCVAYMLIPVMVLNNQILNVKGRSDYFLKAEILKKIIGVLILLVTIPFGLIFICLGMLLYNIFDVIIIIFYSKKVIETGYIKQFKSIFPIFSLAIIMGGAVYLSILLASDPFLQVFVGFLTGLIVYSYLSRLFQINEFNFLLSTLKKVLSVK
jgi:teichuronic acid exporter